MKTQRLETDAPLITAEIWRRFAPPSLSTDKARRLFEKAIRAGLIYYDEEFEIVLPADGITKAQLAYWCKKASTYLGLDKGRMQQTDKRRTGWAPFEALFGYGPRRPLRSTLHNIEESTAPEDYTGEIDAFFEALDAEPAPCTNTSTNTSTKSK
jgi:hypothetical protein